MRGRRLRGARVRPGRRATARATTRATTAGLTGDGRRRARSAGPRGGRGRRAISRPSPPCPRKRRRAASSWPSRSSWSRASTWRPRSSARSMRASSSSPGWARGKTCRHGTELGTVTGPARGMLTRRARGAEPAAAALGRRDPHPAVRGRGGRHQGRASATRGRRRRSCARSRSGRSRREAEWRTAAGLDKGMLIKDNHARLAGGVGEATPPGPDRVSGGALSRPRWSGSTRSRRRSWPART